MLCLETLLTPLGFDPSRRIKLVRHQDARCDLDRLYRAHQLEDYQSQQSRPVFGDAEMLVSFLGRPGSRALFVGVYDVLDVQGPGDFPLPSGFLYPEIWSTNSYLYKLKRDDRFADLHARLIIDWGTGTRSWVQNFRPGAKPLVEVLPSGYVREFPGYLEVVLRFDELVDIIDHPAPHRDWHRMLGSAAGVYLVLDTHTGRQYVGSAYGEGGLLARWRDYAASRHGGNAQLRSLLNDRPGAASDFQFSILQTLPNTMPAKEVIAHEMRHKQKLGTRAHGLNSN